MKLARRALIAAAIAFPVALKAEQFAGVYAPVADRVGDGIWVVRGADAPIEFTNGGAIANSIIMASDEGAIIIDPGPSLNYARALSALSDRLVGRPVGRVFLTHLHPDHTLGMVAFDRNIVAALPGTVADMERDNEGFSDAMYRMLADWMKGTELALPGQRVSAGPASFGGRTMQAFALSGHSAADLALLDETTGTLIAGDLVFHDRAPSTPHANLDGWRTSLDILAAQKHHVLVPGHGPIDGSAGDHGGEAIRQTRDWIDWLEAALIDAVSQGLDMNEAGALEIPARFSRMKAARYELQRSISHFYPRLEAEMLPRLDH